jgi:hypothetical protein
MRRSDSEPSRREYSIDEGKLGSGSQHVAKEATYRTPGKDAMTMTEVSPVRDARPADAMAPGSRLPRGGIKRNHLIYVAIGLIMWHLIATMFFKAQFFPPPLVLLD